MLADPTVFGGVVYFTTYTPPTEVNLCDQGGGVIHLWYRLYSGAGAFPAGTIYVIGTGIASAPIIQWGRVDFRDLYVTVSGGGGSTGSTFRLNFTPPGWRIEQTYCTGGIRDYNDKQDVLMRTYMISKERL